MNSQIMAAVSTCPDLSCKLNLKKIWKTHVNTITLLETNMAPARFRHPKKKRSSSKHPFPGATVDGSEILHQIDR